MKDKRIIGDNQYATHMAPLVASVLHMEGNVYEFGSGDFSTPILHELLKHQKRKLFTYDSEKAWLENFEDLRTKTHIIEHVEDWDAIKVEPGSVVFIDHAPAERRHVDIERLANIASIIVVHDSDKMKYYNYAPVFSKFNYKHTYTRYSKTTTLLSNTINVSSVL